MVISAYIAAAYIGVVALLFFFQRSFIYHPASGDMTPSAYGLPTDVELIRVVTEDGLPLASWYRPAQGDAPTLVYFQGNAGHIGHRADKIRPYIEAGFGVFLLGYRGYGTNPGYPTEARLYMDARAALAFLADRGVPLFRTVLYGESLGTGIAVDMAVDTPYAAVVLEAPYSSIPDVAQRNFPIVPARYLVKDRFDSASKAAHLKSPVLILHGTRDRVIPIMFGRRLFERLPEPRKFKEFPKAGHNDLYFHGAAREVIAFLRQHVIGTAPKTLE